MIDEPVFRNARDALAFAFNFTHGSLKRPFLASLVGASRPGRGLSGLDGAGQAGLIRSALEGLGHPNAQILTARYAPRQFPCPCGRTCCRGWKEGEDWRSAVDELTEHVFILGLTGTISHYRFRRSLVMRYFGVSVHFTDISRQCGVNRDTASDQYSHVVGYFRGAPPDRPGAEWRAFAALEGRLKDQGVIE